MHWAVAFNWYSTLSTLRVNFDINVLTLSQNIGVINVYLINHDQSTEKHWIMLCRHKYQQSKMVYY